MRIIPASLLAILASHGASAQQARIDGIKIQLAYERTGRLSENIASPSQFAGWNTIIGEGSADEPAHDVLVSVSLSTDAKSFFTKTPLQIAVIDGKGRRLAHRVIKSLFIKDGAATRMLMAYESACAGDFKVEARHGTQIMRAAAKLECGE